MRPQIGEALAKRLAAHWGLTEEGDIACSTLPGYDDTNIRLDTTGGASYVYVLKAHNTGDSSPQEQYAEAQNALLLTLAAAGFPVPAPLPLVSSPQPGDISSAVAGGDGYTLRVTAPDGRLHAVRLLTWLPGTLLVDAPQSAELYRQLGALLGRVDRSLLEQGWDWHATGVLRRTFDWDLQHLPATYARVRPHLLHLPAVDVPLLDQVVAHFEAATTAAGTQLRLALIHSDANERNVLVDAAAAEQPAAGAAAAAAAPSAAAAGGLVTGLIDWGDASWQWLAAEPANAAVYMMLLPANIDEPLQAAAALVGGYEREMPLAPAERRLLRTLCMGRLTQSLALGAHAASQQPDNMDYLLGTQHNGWRLLRELWATSDGQFLAALVAPQPI